MTSLTNSNSLLQTEFWETVRRGARFNKVFKWKKAEQQDKQFISVPSPSCPWFFNYIQLSLIPPLLFHSFPFPTSFWGGEGGILFKFLSDHSLTLLEENSFSHLPFSVFDNSYQVCSISMPSLVLFYHYFFPSQNRFLECENIVLLCPDHCYYIPSSIRY